MADQRIDVMENRIKSLEDRIFGQTDKDAVYPKIVNNLTRLSKTLNATMSGRPEAENLMTRISELERCLDPAYTDKLTLSQQAKTEIILAEEDLIRQQASNLEKVKQMAEVLGSEHIKVVPALQTKLQELSKIHIQQQDEAAELTEETKNLLLQYNSAINLLSKQFVQWETLVTKLELSSQPQQQQD